MLFSLRPCAYYQRKHPATQAATSRITAQHGPRDGCTAHLTAQHQQQQAFQTLKEHTPVCLADVTEIHPGYKALAAASDLHNGQTVLELPPCNSLCVPVSGSIYRWECEWLEPFEMAHGSLPDALSLYLSGMWSEVASICCRCRCRCRCSTDQWVQPLFPRDHQVIFGHCKTIATRGTSCTSLELHISAHERP